MANYEAATISTDNKEVFNALEEHFQNEYHNFGYAGVDGETIALRNRHGNTLRDLLELSTLHIDALITLTLAFELHRYEREYTLEVLNGEYTVLSMTEER